MVKSEASAGFAQAEREVASEITPWRASEVHDSRVRRIAATTPDIICPKNARLQARRLPPAVHESGREYPLRESTGKSPDRERKTACEKMSGLPFRMVERTAVSSPR